MYCHKRVSLQDCQYDNLAICGTYHNFLLCEIFYGIVIIINTYIWVHCHRPCACDHTLLYFIIYRCALFYYSLSECYGLLFNICFSLSIYPITTMVITEKNTNRVTKLTLCKCHPIFVDQ
jgi:hypothetical protein